MRNQHSILAIALLATALSCVHKETGPERVTFKAIMADDPATRTVLQSDGSVFWSPRDSINLFYGTSFAMLTADNTTASAQASFTGVLDGFLPNGQDEFWAVYPYSSANRFDGSAVTLTLPNQQNGVAGTFDADLFVSLARSKDYTLQFYNLCGGVKFSVAQTGIQYVTFRGNANEILAGQVTVAFDTDGKPQVQDVLKGATELRLNAPEGGFEVGKWYYIVALPVTLSSGYTMTFFKEADGTGAIERAVDTPVTIKRSTWGRLTDADDVTIPINPNKYLTFTSEGTTTISLVSGVNRIDPVVYYSTDAQNWEQWDYSEITFTNDKPLYMCGNNPEGFNKVSNAIFTRTFSASGDSFSISGDIMSLIDFDNDLTTLPVAGCFYELFKGCTLLTGAPALPATKLTDSCYLGLFNGCSSLKTAPELPATELTQVCYREMFRQCRSLETAPRLPATTLTDACYFEMFSGCSSLSEAPELPAMELASSCYSGMFEKCTGLVTVPNFPATSLASGCCYAMFSGCSSLTKAPALPSTTLADYCYQNMFSECTSLTEAPELPASTLTNGCYRYMFCYCSSLTEAPELPAPVLTKECYSGMFGACYSLSYVKCLATDISAENCLNGWLSSAPYTGTFIKVAEMNDWTWGESGIPQGWAVLYNGETSISATKYLTFSSDGTTSISYSGSSKFTPVLYYSYDTVNWSRWDLSELSFSTNEPLYLCGDNLGGLGSEDTYYRTMTATGDLFAVSGDIMSLIDRNAEKTTAPYNGFIRLFSGCTLLKEAPMLPATTVGSSAYSHMFEGCTGLTTAPELPATTLSYSSYECMFEGCTNLVSVPALPEATFLWRCYARMFKGCTSLTQAPALPAMKLDSSCYASMFEGCTSLTEAPELPATQLSGGCYANMFAGCTSLSVAPELPATELSGSCYSGMFSGCSNLTTAPSLPATSVTSGCYAYMFKGCSKLAKAPILPATAMASSCYNGMFDSCTSLVEAPSLPATTLSDYCYQEMFAHCSSLETAPELPASTLTYYCYGGMFWDCTSLTTAPDLLAEKVGSSSYLGMFGGCTKLNKVKCLATDISAYNGLNEWLKDVSATGTFVKAANVEWPSGTSGIPEGWDVEEL